jgi:hypothetical protein
MIEHICLNKAVNMEETSEQHEFEYLPKGWSSRNGLVRISNVSKRNLFFSVGIRPLVGGADNLLS